MNWLLLTLTSAITLALSRILQKIMLKDDQSDTFAFGFVFQLMVAGLFFIYTLVTQSLELPDLRSVWPNLIVLTVFYSLGNICVFKAFKLAEASEVSIVMATSTVWAVIAALIMLGERVSGLNILGIVLIVGSMIAINYTRSAWKLNRGHAFALLGAVLFGVAFTNDAYILNHYQSVAAYMALAFTLPGLASLVYRPKSVLALPHYAQPSVLKKMILCCVLYALAALTIFTAYKLGGPASIISPIQQTSLIFSVIFSYVLLKERDKVWQKAIGTALAFAGVLLLV